METKVTTHIVKGVILGAVYILLSTIIYAFNLYSIQWLSLLIYLFIFAGIIISNIVYANQNNNNESFGNIFADGFKTTSLFIIISIAFTVLFFILLPEMIEDFIAMQKDNFWTFTIAGNIVLNAIIGAIASLIGAGVAKKNPIDPFSNPAS